MQVARPFPGRRPTKEHREPREPQIVRELRCPQCSLRKTHVVSVNKQEQRLLPGDLKRGPDLPLGVCLGKRGDGLQYEMTTGIRIQFQLPQIRKLQFTNLVCGRDRYGSASVSELPRVVGAVKAIRIDPSGRTAVGGIEGRNFHDTSPT